MRGKSSFHPLVLSIALLLPFAAFAEEPAKPETRRECQLAGWNVRIDERLFTAPHEPLGQRAIKLLEARLTDIATVVPPRPLAELRAVPIVLDLTHGKLTSMQYHPSEKWLTENGYASDLAKSVHLPDAARFVAPRHQFVQPWCVLHELAHAYHDRVLSFDEPRIHAEWDRYVAAGRGSPCCTSAAHVFGHYALSNGKEFFAEMSEAYFGLNDFFPFNHAELRESQPGTHALLVEIWGPVP